MKKYILCALFCLLALMAGCKKTATEQTPSSAGGAQIAYAAWLHDQGYQSAEGWMYDMALTDPSQLKALNDLLNGSSFQVLDQVFEYGKGYLITFRGTSGSITNELLLLEDGQASMGGMLYESENAQPLLDWLNALHLDEQEME